MSITIDGTNGITTPLVTTTNEIVTNMPSVTTPQSMVQLNTANGYGSTNTMIRRFTNVVTNQGTDITYADSVTNGASFTINTNGVYAISYNDQFSSTTNAWLGISLNSNQLTTSIISISPGNILSIAYGAAIGGPTVVSSTPYLAAGAIVRAHTGGISSGSNTGACQFTITRIS